MVVVSAPTLDRIQHEELVKLFGRMLGARMAFLPAVTMLLCYIAWSDGLRLRFYIVLTLLLGAGAFFIKELLTFRRTGFRRGAVDINVAAILTAQITITAATGGIESPFAVAAVPVSVLNGLFVGNPLSIILPLGQAAAFWIMAYLQWNWHNASLALILMIFVFAARLAGNTVRGTFNGMVQRGLEAERATIASYDERRTELLALSGELAHELKNPLASIKGLATLLDESIGGGKPKERLTVLRGEVERMQATLESFLNFSRPLVPLVVAKVSLDGLARDVAAMHEGMAREHHIAISVHGEGAATCDVRKVKQIVVNLVQNAIEAGGNAVEIHVADNVMRVSDRGAGVPAELVGRVFDAGVTMKSSGSGLGLTIARALARQHDGDLTLQARVGGGTVATLTLGSA